VEPGILFWKSNLSFLKMCIVENREMDIQFHQQNNDKRIKANEDKGSVKGRFEWFHREPS